MVGEGAARGLLRPFQTEQLRWQLTAGCAGRPAQLTLVLYKGDIFLEPRLFEVRLLEILKNSVFFFLKLSHEPLIFEVLEKFGSV